MSEIERQPLNLHRDDESVAWYAETVREVSQGLVLHWNYRGLAALPIDLSHCGGRVTELYLKGNSIESLPGWINQLTNLTTLYLASNRLTELPNSLHAMVNLEILDVSQNYLETLPEALGRLTRLAKLNATHNRLRRLPDAVGRLAHLTSLQLSGNELAHLPHSLSRCAALQELTLDLNRFVELPNFLMRLPELRRLSACRNRLVVLPATPFAKIELFLFDGNAQVSHLPYALACQLSQRPETGASDGVVYVSTYGCFAPDAAPQSTFVNLTVTPPDDAGVVRPPPVWCRLPSDLRPSEAAQVCTLVELVLRSMIRRRFDAPWTGVERDDARCLHRWPRAPFHGGDYDAWTADLAPLVPDSLVDLLRRGPHGLCLQCGAAVFHAAQPLFVAKTLVPKSTDQTRRQRVLCCLMFCSLSCSRRLADASDAQGNGEDGRPSWERNLLRQPLQWTLG